LNRWCLYAVVALRLATADAAPGEFHGAMTMTRAYEAKGRKRIFLLVLLGHCVLIFVITRSNNSQKSATQILREPLSVFFLDSIKIKTEANAVKEPGPAPTKARTRSTHPSIVPLTHSETPAAPDPTSSDAITDWYGQAHTVAEDALENDRNKNANRAFEHKMPGAQVPEPTSIWAPPPVRRAGTWEGSNRFYITDNCYYEWDPAPRPPPTLLDNRLMTPVCKPPSKGGGDAMFKDLTPGYRKTLPDPKSH